ncbi:MAG TPA: BTAD domain-containing putative transcriptional regulator [Anaerolineales bacterium]|nr:BTAD domain-containing putative transcriptional regulator [Anaerolineales bacterium]
MARRLGLHLLGSPQLYLDNELITADRRKAVALLAYLAVEGGKHTRDSLSALLWPDYDQSKAFSNLRHTLWEVQQAIGEGWVIADRETIGLNEDADISLDLSQFESLLRQSRTKDDASLRISLLSDSVKIYRNHFLTGFSLKDAPDFNEWAFAKSEDVRHKLSTMLTMLSDDYCALGQADQAIPYARRLITLDPLNESSHRQLMNVYIQAGQHSAALKQYQACEQLLRKELGVDPQPETRELYKKIRKRDLKPIKVEQQKETSTPQHNIPLQLSSFIGREKEQKTIAKLITVNRLVTLIGTGGIGKTRLSLKVGEGILDKFENGVWFVELASLNDSSLVPQAAAAVFGIIDRSETTSLEKLVDLLRAKTSLLILDNCEHLLFACAQLADTLLKNCPNLKILVTSREGLGIPGEALYRVPSLSVPRVEKNIEQLADSESIRLFTDRARLSVSDFCLKMENIPTIAQICRRLDGIPLAIELAAARVNILSEEQIAARLNESFSLLTSNSRTKLARQQTLQASIDWSWNLLSDSERILLRRLSVFGGGWTLEAAESICSEEGIESGQVLDLITQLVMKSLVVADQESGRERRYRLLEMIRQYAREKLVESSEEEKIRDRHLKYFLQLSETFEVQVIGHRQEEWFLRANDERDNLRAALHWANRTDLEAGLYISARLLAYWEISNLREGIQWLETFLNKSESRDFPLARAAALLTYGWLLTWLQRFIPARTATQESLSLFRTTGDRRGEIDSLISLANISQFTDALDSGTELLHQALTLSQALGDRWRQAESLGFLGWDRRDQKQAFLHWEKAIELYREVGDQLARANLLGLLGLFKVLNGEIEVGEKYLNEATTLWESNNRTNVWEHTKTTKSLILLARGEFEQAYEVLQDALASAQKIGNRMSYLWQKVRLGYAALYAGNLGEAHDTFVETTQNFHRDGYTVGVVFAVEGIATLLVTTSKHEKAAQLLGWADATREQIHDNRPLIEEANIYRNMSAIIARIGPSAFEVAYDDGRSMTSDEAVRFALGEEGKKMTLQPPIEFDVK